MFDRSLIKSNAKTSLKRFYGLALVAILIVSVISSIGSSLTAPDVDATEFSESVTSYITTQDEAAYQEMMDECNEMIAESTADASDSWKNVVSLVFALLVTNILTVGMSRFYLRAREYPASVGDLFYGYKKGFGRNVLTMFLRGLYVFLWSLLFVVPGIVKSYEYSMIPYILAENPNISRKRAFELSKAMTKGYKGNLFMLDLSFIGWTLLGGVCCCGVGTIFLAPYISASWAEAYTFLKARALESGAATFEDLPGITAE